MNIDWQMLALNIQQKLPLVKASKKNRLNKGYLSQLARGGDNRAAIFNRRSTAGFPFGCMW